MPASELPFFGGYKLKERYVQFKILYIPFTSKYHFCDFYEVSEDDGTPYLKVIIETDKIKSLSVFNRDPENQWSLASEPVDPFLKKALLKYIGEMGL